MGWWDEGIMGGDTPLDFKGDFEDKFGSIDPDFNKYRIEDGEEPIEFVKPNPIDVISFINECEQRLKYSEEILRQVVGFLVMERGAPMSDQLRDIVLEGIDAEIDEGAIEWGKPKVRLERLNEFRKAVVAYPPEGGEITMPNSPGLFDKLAERFS